MNLKHFLIILLLFIRGISFASYILIPMDDTQKNHLKAYGIAYYALQNEIEIDWLLNYRGGSFTLKDNKTIQEECIIRNVSYQLIADAQYTAIISEISEPNVNMDLVKLEKAPKIAVYSPKNKLPWDDAVTLALSYAEIPYDIIYDEEVLKGILPMYDWLHLHHEDFTGQYGKFWAKYKDADWYIEEVQTNETTAKKLGFDKVSELKKNIAYKIRDFVAGGGFLFAMCSACDSYDIALSAENTDICHPPFDGDPTDQKMQQKLDFSKTFAFTNFTLNNNPYDYAKSNIDVSLSRTVEQKEDLFTLFDFSAKWDPVPSMLCQNHEKVIRGFMGQSTAFNKNLIKANVLIMGENKSLNEARYLHGEFGKGTFTFYGGHDPEDYRHFIGDPPTDLSLHPNSSGYRLILNNILFPAAKKKKQKT